MSKNIELIFRENMGEYINNIKKENPKARFYSHSRLGTYNQCKRSYYYTYIDKKPQKAGVYSTLGTSVHTTLEELYEGKVDKLNRDIFDNDFAKCELFGIKFPESKYDIKGGYKKDIYAFYDVYKKRSDEDCKFISELGFILKIDKDHYEIGYIDLLILNNDGTCDIVDFKTSSDFDKNHVVEAGRQLILYKLAIEQLYGIKVNTVAWEMLKYCNVKVGKNREKKAVKGREWVKKISSQIKTLMKNKGYDPVLTDMYIAKAEIENTINGLPDDIKKEISVNTYIREYDVTQELIEECLEYTKRSIKEIEELDNSNIELWKPSVDKFFCKNLCGFSCTECKYWEYEIN